jgi:hypothetical protein
MKAKPNTQKSRTLTRTAAITIAAIVVIGAGVWLIGRHLTAIPSNLADPIRWPAWFFGGLFVVVLLVILLHSIHEEHVISRTVADFLRGRPPMTDEEFGRRYYANDLAPLAAQLRRMLADNLGCDLSGIIPSDDFEKWLYLFPGPDSAADSFFEELAIEFQLTRDCPWPQRFGSFDALVRFVAEHAYEHKTH